jgi:hypothetical protein
MDSLVHGKFNISSHPFVYVDTSKNLTEIELVKKKNNELMAIHERTKDACDCIYCRRERIFYLIFIVVLTITIVLAIRSLS